MTDNYIGRSIEMGRYQKPGRKKDYEPIVWKILDVIDDKALIWSEKLLVQKPFNEEESANVTWQNNADILRPLGKTCMYSAAF